MIRRGIGDGDTCPQDARHGRMWAYPVTRHQFCPHSGHRGKATYEWDGVTPTGAPKRTEAPASR